MCPPGPPVPVLGKGRRAPAPAIGALAALALAALASGARADEADDLEDVGREPATEIEVRVATEGYRYVGLSRLFGFGLLLETLYIGVGDVSEAYVGVGYDARLDAELSIVPIAYAVYGLDDDERGATLGAYLDLDTGAWRSRAFVGRFTPRSGDVSRYAFVDSFRLTRVLGRWEAGVSAEVYGSEGEYSWLAGPLLGWDDGLGSWAASARSGDGSEWRVVRTIEF